MFIRILGRDTNRRDQQLQEREKEQITKYIRDDLKTMDLKISLYIAACGGLPLSDIHPSPPAISSESNRIENASLLSANDSIPPPESLLAMLKHPEGQVLPMKTYNVLKWLALGLKEPRITYLGPETYQDIMKLGESDNTTKIEPEPEAIFSLKPHTLSTLGQEWASRTRYEDVNTAFLPCKIEFLHCLMYKGLVSDSIEKDGSLVLYTDLKYCVEIAPSGWTWGKSMLGINLKVVAIVEFVDSALNVKIDEVQVEHSDLGSLTLKNYRLLDPTCCRIRYLLVYPQEKRHPPYMVQSVPAKKKIVRSSLALAWVLIILTCVLPRLKKAEIDTL